uniref:Uncharacterized protein n=2 Tax=Sus scrofa TaxID=9823 RepID=A0A8D0JFV4_PIG
VFRTDLLPMALHSTAPFLPPWPSHLPQITFFCRASFLVAPLHRSSKISMGEPEPSLSCVLFLYHVVPFSLHQRALCNLEKSV